MLSFPFQSLCIYIYLSNSAEFRRERSATLSNQQRHHPTFNALSIADMPGPSGLHTHTLHSSSPLPSSPSGSSQGEGEGHGTGAWVVTGGLPDDALLGEVRPYVRKRRRKPNTGIVCTPLVMCYYLL